MQKKIFYRLTAILITAIMLSIFVNYAYQLYVAKQDVLRHSEMLFAQVESLIWQNSLETDRTRHDYNDICLAKARGVAYALRDEASLNYDVNEWRKLTRLLSIDEIHIFNDQGEIITGSEPKYYGYRFTSGKQMQFSCR